MITKEMINSRLEKLQADYNQQMANLQAIHGAIQDCQYWLEQFKEDEEETE